MRALNLALRFLLEVFALVLVGWAVFRLDIATAARVGAAVLAVAAFAGTWWAFVAPKAPRRLADPGRLVLELVLFGLVVAATAAAGSPIIAMVYAVAVAANVALLFLLGQRGA